MKKMIRKFFIITLLTIGLGGGFGVYKVHANHYTPWIIESTSSPKCEYIDHGSMGRRGYLVQYITYKRTIMNGKTGKTRVERRKERVIMGQGGGAGCPVNP